MLHRPVGPAAAHAKDKIVENFAAARRVGHFGMKLDAEETPRRIGEGGDRRVGAVRQD